MVSTLLPVIKSTYHNCWFMLHQICKCIKRASKWDIQDFVANSSRKRQRTKWHPPPIVQSLDSSPSKSGSIASGWFRNPCSIECNTLYCNRWNLSREGWMVG